MPTFHYNELHITIEYMQINAFLFFYLLFLTGQLKSLFMCTWIILLTALLFSFHAEAQAGWKIFERSRGCEYDGHLDEYFSLQLFRWREESGRVCGDGGDVQFIF